MINTILWDMDGVLVETSEAHYRSWLAAASHFNFPFNRELFLRHYGMNNAGTLHGILGKNASPELIAAIGDYKENCFREDMKNRMELLPGVQTWLERFRQSGYRQAVASSGPPENIAFSVDATGIRGYFDALISCADGPTKPDPWVFQEAARQLNAKPEECLVIEDTPNGIQAARNAGTRVLAVTTSNPATALQAADLVVENLEKLDWVIYQRIFNLEDEHE
jgi:HAD superfamily hydrolase (TIGR01509 family)